LGLLGYYAREAQWMKVDMPSLLAALERDPFMPSRNTPATTPIFAGSKALRLSLVLGSVLILGACSIPSLQFPGVYKIDIQQGNIITQEMIDQLRPGMTKRQVIFVMGTPLVRDPFDQDRWDYVYSYQPGGGERGQERVTMFFENDLLTHFTGDFKPSDETAAEAPASAPAAASS
jgi:outer membrane protein assembly factor BamE (lipoprotein component of BamABCDE complex)